MNTTLKVTIPFTSFALLLLFCVLFDRMPRTSGDITLLYPKHSPTLTWQERKNTFFGNDYTDTIVLNLDLNSENDRDSQLQLEEIKERLMEIAGITEVLTPIITLPIEHDPFGLKVRNKSLVRILLKIDGNLDQSKLRQVNDQITELLEQRAYLEARRAGSFFTAQEVAKTVDRETQRVTPWVVLILGLLLVILFKNLRTGFLVLGLNLLAVGTTLLAYSAMGYALGPVTQLAPPFLLAVGAAFNVHVVSRLQQSPLNQRLDTLRELRAGITLASLTTSGSLVSLVFLDVSGVTRFAILSASGVLLGALYAMMLGPRILKPCDSTSDRTNLRISRSLSRIIAKPFGKWAAVITLGLASSIGSLSINTDPLDFLPSSSSARQQITEVNQNFPGNHYLSLILSRREGIGLQHDTTTLSLLKNEIQRIPGVVRAINPIELELNSPMGPNSGESSNPHVNKTALSSGLISKDHDHLNFLIETKAEGQELIEVRDRIESSLNHYDTVLGNYDYGIASQELILAEQTTHITRGLIKSLGTTIGLVFGLLLLIFRSLPIALVGLVPNILPLLGVFGLLGYLTQELNFGSCLVATAALGIAVDNTFHFLFCWKAQTRGTGNTLLSVNRVLKQTARPFLTTTVALAISFSAMLAAEAVPVRHFGALLGATLILGLIADLIVLPHLLLKVSRTHCYLKKR